MSELIWYLAKNIKPVEHEDVLVYDQGARFFAYWVSGNVGSSGYWIDRDGEHLLLSEEAYWTDLPKP